MGSAHVACGKRQPLGLGSIIPNSAAMGSRRARTRHALQLGSAALRETNRSGITSASTRRRPMGYGEVCTHLSAEPAFAR